MTEGAPSGSVRVERATEDPESVTVNVGRGERLVSIVVGGLVALGGLRRISLSGLALAVGGAALAYRGLSGHCATYRWLDIDTAAADESAEAGEIKVTLIVDRPREAVYAAWREFEAWPRFMHHLESVTPLAERRHHWVARGPQGVPAIEWDTELVEDRTDELIAWQSLPGARVHNTGWVSFRDAPAGGGTEMHVEVHYRPAGGDGNLMPGRWLTPITRQLIMADIRRFKSYAEAGETSVTGDLARREPT